MKRSQAAAMASFSSAENTRTLIHPVSRFDIYVHSAFGRPCMTVASQHLHRVLSDG